MYDSNCEFRIAGQTGKISGPRMSHMKVYWLTMLLWLLKLIETDCLALELHSPNLILGWCASNAVNIGEHQEIINVQTFVTSLLQLEYDLHGHFPACPRG